MVVDRVALAEALAEQDRAFLVGDLADTPGPVCAKKTGVEAGTLPALRAVSGPAPAEPAAAPSRTDVLAFFDRLRAGHQPLILEPWQQQLIDAQFEDAIPDTGSLS